MSFKLPEFCLDVLSVAVSCLNVQLIEWCVNWNELDFSVGLEVSFKTSVEILSYCLLNSVPKSDFLDQVVT